jgi:hypothetical protein
MNNLPLLITWRAGTIKSFFFGFFVITPTPLMANALSHKKSLLDQNQLSFQPCSRKISLIDKEE